MLKQLTVWVNEYEKHYNAALKFKNITVGIGKASPPTHLLPATLGWCLNSI